MAKLVFALVLWGAAVTSLHAATAPLSLVSWGVQINPGSARDPLTGLEWVLSISTLDSSSEPNHELMVADETIPYSHQSIFTLVEPTTLEPLRFGFVLDVPNQGDVNTNGVPDFFDRPRETTNEQTAGRYATPDGNGADFTARWTRLSGRVEGTVTLAFPDLGLTFTHDYNIPTYEGTFSYTNINGSVQGSVQLTKVLSPEEKLSGPLNATVINTNRLQYAGGNWTGASGVYPFSAIDTLDRLGSSYVALTAFTDGNLQTPEVDYEPWFIIISTTDQNANSVPDLVETPGTGPARLEIRRTAIGTELTIQGTAGKSYVVEGTTSLRNATWQEVRTVTLTGSSAVVESDFTGGARFFRVRASE